MQSTYDEAIRRLLVHEGGYTNDASDPGGPTNFGITIFDVRKYLNPNATAADVRALTIDQAKTIYRTHYATPLHYDDLPAGVDYAVFDYGVNSGISRAAKVLQKLCGVEPDGEIGPVTVANARAKNSAALVDAICNERLAFLKSLRTWPVFGNGWGRRVSEVRGAALVMAKAAIIAPHPSPAPGKGQQPKPPSVAKPIGIVGAIGAMLASAVHASGYHWIVTATVIVAAIAAALVIIARKG